MKESYRDSWVCCAEIAIFSICRFADWKNKVPSYDQFRMFWGALFIALFFVMFYISRIFDIRKNYKGEGKRTQYLRYTFFTVLGFASYLFSYFVESRY